MKLFTGSWKTTALGILTLGVSVLVAMGVFTPEEAATANEALVGMVENIFAVIGTITGFIAMFSRDNNVSSEKAGAK